MDRLPANDHCNSNLALPAAAPLLVPERSDILPRALEATGSDVNITAGALVTWLCDALLSNHSVKAYGRDLMDFFLDPDPWPA